MIALVFDTETTALIDNHTVKLEQQPFIVEWFSQLVDLDKGGKIISELELLIKPPGTLPEITTKITGITQEMLAGALPFKEVFPQIKMEIETAPLAIAHNASFDVEVTDVEFERLGQKVAWPRVICSVEQTIGLKGFRLSLSNLHVELFGESFPEAHRARRDVEALVRCCIELRRRGML